MPIIESNIVCLFIYEFETVYKQYSALDIKRTLSTYNHITKIIWQL